MNINNVKSIEFYKRLGNKTNKDGYYVKNDSLICRLSNKDSIINFYDDFIENSIKEPAKFTAAYVVSFIADTSYNLYINGSNRFNYKGDTFLMRKNISDFLKK